MAPTPSGYLHEGHARTFRVAWERAVSHCGVLVYRNDDLDPLRCREEFTRSAMADLKSCGLTWSEGPDCGGKFGPYDQSKRGTTYLSVLRRLAEMNLVYPCVKSRKEIRKAGLSSSGGEEFLFPEQFRPAEKFSMGSDFPGEVN